jgi:hypothetical protein
MGDSRRGAWWFAPFFLVTLLVADATGACRSTCTEALRTCGRTCARLSGPARRLCRQRCAEQSTCDAPGVHLRLGMLVVNECTADAAGLTTFKQRLITRRGNCDPVTIMEIPEVGPVPDPLGLCRIYGDFRTGAGSVGLGAFQKIAVLPNASAIVFELTSQHSLAPYLSPALPDEGIFVARPDGRGLRRVGDATRVRLLDVTPDPTSPVGLAFVQREGTVFGVSPNSRQIAFVDVGPGPSGAAAHQVYLLDLATGERRQLTHLPPPTSGVPICCATFSDNQTVTFFDGPIGVGARVHTDGSGFEMLSVDALPGSHVVPQFGIEGGAATKVIGLSLPGVPPRKTYGPGGIVREVFRLDGPRLLQLTNFGYPDTNLVPWGRGRVFVIASANPLARNPTENCQLFSVDPLGGGLRQLTSFRDPGAVNLGCGGGVPGAACAFSGGGSQDAASGYLGFGSQCDPFGRNPYGEQIFSLRPDGSGLRQTTSFRGRELLPDGGVHVELGGPVAQAVVY